MLSDLYLLKINLLEAIPEWLEAIALILTGAGGFWAWWTKHEGKRLDRMENAQDQILTGYDSLIEEFRLAHREKDDRIKDLTKENNRLIRQQATMSSKIKEQQSVIESLKIFNKTLKQLKDAPEDVIFWLEQSPLNEFIEGEKSVREILLERVEKGPDTDLSNLPPSQG